MQKLIYLPNVELNMEGVRVTEWRVSVGDAIALDQILMEVETQKAAVEVPSPEAGYVRKLCVGNGDEVTEKQLLCVITDTADEPFEAPGLAAESAQAAQTESAPVVEPALIDGGGVRSVPLARRIARDAGIAIESITGTGPSGRISVADVQAAVGIAGRSGSSAGGEWTDLPASRVALNQQMVRSLSEIPQIHLSRQIDVTALAVKQPGMTFTHRLIVAVARALVSHPALRTKLDGARVRVEPVGVAVALDTPHGLVAPVIRGADRMNVADIAAALTDFRDRAGRNALRREELIDGPFAITNLGMHGIDFFNAFVFHGQTAVLAVGRATQAPAGRQVAWFNLAVDHRIVDGAEGAKFLETLQNCILEHNS